MAVYVWEGRTRQGGVVRGEMEAASDVLVAAQLRRQQIQPSRVRAKGAGGAKLKLPGFGGRVGDKDLAVFTRQFSTMINAGLPLVQCLEILALQQKKERFRKKLLDIKQQVESGSTFTEALKKHPDVFDDLYANMVAAGEVGGILDVILQRLAAYIEKAMKLKKQIKGAMVYPIAIMGVAIVVVSVLLIFVIPIFQKMFVDMGGELPGPTQLVITMSNFMRGNILFIIGAGVAVGFVLRRIYRTPKGKDVIDALLLKAPVFGDLIRKIAVAKFSRTLGTLVKSGVPILDGLEIVARTAGNKVIERALMSVRVEIAQGKTIAEPLGHVGVFPPMVVQMVGVGESTGAMDEMLAKIADFYEEEVDSAVAALTSLLEPAMMVVLGGLIGGLVVAMYLPIFKLAGTVG
ncbi:MAG: type II secretion system F family protein [Deltaproteobacteria bacterium]|nr:type II secretion system F family protein [Deltaproteobacteria bacterium]